jgi:uncharacterized membrane protein
MPATLVFGLSLLHLAVYTEAAVIVLLLLFGIRVCEANERIAKDRSRARRERDEAQANLRALRRMSEIRVETVTRLRGFSR